MAVASDEDTCHQNSKPSTLPFLLSSANYHYFHSLMKAPDNPPPPKHSFNNSIQTINQDCLPPAELKHGSLQWDSGII